MKIKIIYLIIKILYYKIDKIDYNLLIKKIQTINFIIKNNLIFIKKNRLLFIIKNNLIITFYNLKYFFI